MAVNTEKLLTEIMGNIRHIEYVGDSVHILFALPPDVADDLAACGAEDEDLEDDDPLEHNERAAAVGEDGVY